MEVLRKSSSQKIPEATGNKLHKLSKTHTHTDGPLTHYELNLIKPVFISAFIIFIYDTFEHINVLT